MDKKLRLYVWEGVLADYTGGIAFAVASSADEARKLIEREFLKHHRVSSDYLRNKIRAELQGKPVVRKAGFCYGGG